MNKYKNTASPLLSTNLKEPFYRPVLQNRAPQKLTQKELKDIN